MVVRRSIGRNDQGPFRNLANFFQSLFLCLSDKILTLVGPFYPVSMLGEVKDPTQTNEKTCRGHRNGDLDI